MAVGRHALTRHAHTKRTQKKPLQEKVGRARRVKCVCVKNPAVLNLFVSFKFQDVEEPYCPPYKTALF